MTTIKCPNCGIELEGDADPGDEIECPSCGRAFTMPSRKQFSIATKRTSEVQTIQRTSKKYKVCAIIGALFLISAGAAFVFAMKTNNESSLWWGGVLGGIGALFSLYAKIGSWWTNG